MHKCECISVSVLKVLQCMAVCGTLLQCVALCCSVLQCVAACCSVLQCVAACCGVSWCVAVGLDTEFVCTSIASLCKGSFRALNLWRNSRSAN